jgi:hypothetical protein
VSNRHIFGYNRISKNHTVCDSVITGFQKIY